MWPTWRSTGGQGNSKVSLASKKLEEYKTEHWVPWPAELVEKRQTREENFYFFHCTAYTYYNEHV